MARLEGPLVWMRIGSWPFVSRLHIGTMQSGQIATELWDSASPSLLLRLGRGVLPNVGCSGRAGFICSRASPVGVETGMI